MKALAAVLLLVTLRCSWAVSPTNCTAIRPEAEKVLDLINKARWSGYAFRLLRVADAHLDSLETAIVYYLVLDVKETDCWVLSGKHGEDCEPPGGRRPSDIVIGQCKVIATRYSNESRDLRVNDFNCTTSSVSSALVNSKDSPVLLDFFEDTELYRKQADKALDKHKGVNDAFASFKVDRVERASRARGGQGTIYFLDFSVRNCSAYHFPRHPSVFGFCRADFSYDTEASDLENPKHLDIDCEVFNLEEHWNSSGMRPHWGHLQHMGRHEHSLAGKHPFKPSGSRDHNHPHKPHKFGCPPPPEEKDEGGPPLMPPLGPRCQHPHFGINRTHRLLHNNSSSEQPPHGLPLHRHGPHGACPHGHPPHGPPPPGHHPHGPPPHGHHPHGPPPHGHHPHGPPPHGHHPHGPPPHGHHPHGPPPHGHHPHGPPPHGHHPQGPPPHGHHPHDFGPCVPPPHSQGPQDHHLHGHGPPHRHSGKRGPGKGHFPFHRKQFGYVHRLRPLNVGEVLPPPEANFPSFILPNCKSPGQSDILSFPESTSESCPGKFENILPGIAKFFSHIPPK